MMAIGAEPPCRLANGHLGQVRSGEGEGFGEVRATDLPGRGVPGVHLGHHHALVAGGGDAAQQLGAGLLAPAGDQVLVGVGPLDTPVPSARWMCARRVPMSLAITIASEAEAAVCDRSRVTLGTSSLVGSQCGA